MRSKIDRGPTQISIGIGMCVWHFAIGIGSSLCRHNQILIERHTQNKKNEDRGWTWNTNTLIGFLFSSSHTNHTREGTTVQNVYCQNQKHLCHRVAIRLFVFKIGNQQRADEKPAAKLSQHAHIDSFVFWHFVLRPKFIIHINFDFVCNVLYSNDGSLFALCCARVSALHNF